MGQADPRETTLHSLSIRAINGGCRQLPGKSISHNFFVLALAARFGRDERKSQDFAKNKRVLRVVALPDLRAKKAAHSEPF
jgi:hypothetical protein